VLGRSLSLNSINVIWTDHCGVEPYLQHGMKPVASAEVYRSIADICLPIDRWLKFGVPFGLSSKGKQHELVKIVAIDDRRRRGSFVCLAK
jgi:hypothetical protein